MSASYISPIKEPSGNGRSKNAHRLAVKYRSNCERGEKKRTKMDLLSDTLNTVISGTKLRDQSETSILIISVYGIYCV